MFRAKPKVEKHNLTVRFYNKEEANVFANNYFINLFAKNRI